MKANNWFSAAVCTLLGCGSANAADLKPSQLAAIDRYVTAEMARERIPGAEVGIYRDGHAILKKGYGLANVELSVAVTPDTLMQSGSTGKQFVATAIMQLVEQGKLKLDDGIAQYFADAPPSWKPIRVKNLLSHTSGLAEYESAERARPGGEFDLRLDFSEEELVHKIEQLPIDFAVGADCCLQRLSGSWGNPKTRQAKQRRAATNRARCRSRLVSEIHFPIATAHSAYTPGSRSNSWVVFGCKGCMAHC